MRLGDHPRSDGAVAPAPGQLRDLPRATVIATVLLCWTFIVFDGYDLIVYGTLVSSLQREWGISAAQSGLLGSAAFLGMIFGALIAGNLSDRLGRRSLLIICVAVFSVFTALCGVAVWPWMFGAFRLVAGLGLGGVVVVANALASEVVTNRMRPVVATILMSGVPIGGCLAAVVGIPTIPALGWRAMLFFAAAPLLLLPVAARLIPGVLVRGPGTSRPEPDAGSPAGLRGIFVPGYALTSGLFAAVVASVFIAWYGLGTWLPNLMEASGYNLGTALQFTLALNLGAVAGSVVTAWAGRTFGPVRAACIAAGIAGLALVVMGTSPPAGALYVLLALAGIGAHGSACLVTSAVVMTYPTPLRGAGLGWAFGIGRIGALLAPVSAGWILALGFGATANFFWFGAMALVAAVLFGVLWITSPGPARRATVS